jgi:hypothetical protein
VEGPCRAPLSSTATAGERLMRRMRPFEHQSRGVNVFPVRLTKAIGKARGSPMGGSLTPLPRQERRRRTLSKRQFIRRPANYSTPPWTGRLKPLGQIYVEMAGRRSAAAAYACRCSSGCPRPSRSCGRRPWPEASAWMPKGGAAPSAGDLRRVCEYHERAGIRRRALARQPVRAGAGATVSLSGEGRTYGEGRAPGSGDVHGTRRGRCYALRSPRHLSDRSTRVVLP